MHGISMLVCLEQFSIFFFFFSSRRRHTRLQGDWSSDVCSSDLVGCAISGKSKLRVADCGNMLEAVLAKKLGERAIIGVFGDSLMWVPFSESDTCLAIKNRIDALAQQEERSEHHALAIPQFRKGQGV